ncbi:MAG: hypothetical protein RI575_09595 [Balneolaceae bacterium]|nr:hypothetical protein [Balneolaceae bacterium]MDR9408332.1 hypothetical protein [Balneolaceae bacterium]
MKTKNHLLSFYSKVHSNPYLKILTVFIIFAGLISCSTSGTFQDGGQSSIPQFSEANRPDPDPRVGLEPGVFDAEETIWNLQKLSSTPPPIDFISGVNSDLAFKGNYVIQGNFNGFMVWDISNPESPELVVDYLCPASQSDVSVYEDLLFVSGEGLEGRLDCGSQGVEETVSEERLRGIRIFDISDIRNPEYISNVQTCRGSHTHSVLKDPDDNENVYVYVSGSAMVRPEEELPGCSNLMPDEDPNSALFRIEIIQVPLDNPEDAAIVNSPRIFENLEEVPTHGLSPADIMEAENNGKFIGVVDGEKRIVSDQYVEQFLNSIVEERGGTGEPTAADSSELRGRISEMLQDVAAERAEETDGRGPNQCHDITLYPEIGLAGGACEGYGLLLDISDPVKPVRIDAVADSNFAYWHSATFNNDGSKVLFTDEWGGGTQPKCRVSDPMEWGANAIFTVEQDSMAFKSYFKMPAPQTSQENCVAHNGSLIPIPGRDIMVQSWYQGGINIFDWTDPENPIEMAFHDRGPLHPEQSELGGSWSVYWYNGKIVNSEIARGLDIFELVPSDFLTENEIEAANTVELSYLNAQGQPRYEWPPSFVLMHAYLDQLERSREYNPSFLQSIREGLIEAEQADEVDKAYLLNQLARRLEVEANGSNKNGKARILARTMKTMSSRI